MFAKVMVLVNFVLAVAFLAAAGTLHGSAESWKGRYGDLEKQKDQTIQALEGQLKAKSGELDQARAESRALEGRAQAAEAVQKQQAESNANLNRQLEVQNAEVSKLQSNNTDLANAVKEQTGRNEQLMNQNSQLSADLAQAKEKLSTTEEVVVRETQRADNAEKSLAASEATNKTLTENLDASNTALTAYQKKFGALGDLVAIKAVKGVVQAASAGDDVFVLSVGSKDGVKVGYEFTVSRGDKYVSTIVIDSVFPNHSAGHTKTGMKKLDVQAGDSVATATGL
jgi:chromosome segregation ATPase